MAEIQGKFINFKVRENGTSDDFLAVACMEDTTFQITNETTERRTNCGVKTGISDPTFSITGNAVQEVPPAADHVSYLQVKAWQKSKTKLDFTYINEADTANGITSGEAVNTTGSGFFTESSYDASAEADGIGSFSFTFTGTGTLDEFDDES